MKRYISAILIPSLFLQLNGCALSYQEISLEELKKHNSLESLHLRITTKEGKSILNDESENKIEYNWTMSDSSIVIVKREIFINDITLVLDTSLIKYSEIAKIEIGDTEKFGTLEIVGIVVGSLVLLGLAIILIANSFHLSDADAWRGIANSN